MDRSEFCKLMAGAAQVVVGDASAFADALVRASAKAGEEGAAAALMSTHASVLIRHAQLSLDYWRKQAVQAAPAEVAELQALREQATLVQEVLGLDLASETARSELYTLGLHARETATLRSQLNSADLSLTRAEEAHRQEVDTLRAEITTLRKKVGDSR